MSNLTCFKAYDIRGRLGIDLDPGVAYRIGRAFAKTLGAKTVVLGHDVRASSEELAQAITNGLIDAGCDVLSLGLSGTEEMYFATSHYKADGGICVTASHNPMDYNGMKLVREGSAPLDTVNALTTVRTLAEADDFGAPKSGGRVRDIASEAREAYVERILSFVDINSLKPIKILVNAGHGTAGPTFDAIVDCMARKGSPLRFETLFHAPDGNFPQGIPNPLLPENRPVTAQAVKETGANFGVAWDGDFDRCFFFDHTGEFIDGEYVVGLLAEAFLAKSPGETIIHDPRLIWNTRDIVAKAGGSAVQARTGHAFIKQAMRDHNAIYGGEMSAHHYFRDFFYCDSGMIPWLLVAELVSRHGALAGLVRERKTRFPSSGEINFMLEDPQGAIARVCAEFEPLAKSVDRMDGFGFDLESWRFNLRISNTEPVVRLNVESLGDTTALKEGIALVQSLLSGQ